MGFTLREQIIISYVTEHQNNIYQRNELIKENKSNLEELLSNSKELKRLNSDFNSFCNEAITTLSFEDFNEIESIWFEYKYRRHPELALKLEVLKRKSHND